MCRLRCRRYYLLSNGSCLLNHIKLLLQLCHLQLPQKGIRIRGESKLWCSLLLVSDLILSRLLCNILYHHRRYRRSN